MMADSFFTTRNMYDLQCNHFDQLNCEMLLDAVTRRMAKLNGPMGASVKTQRVADILAVAYVLPVAHWADADVKVVESVRPPPADTPARPARQRLWDFLKSETIDHAMFWGVIGFALGIVVAN